VNVKEYTQFLERLGQKIVWMDQVPFSMYRPLCYWSVPRFAPYTIDPKRVKGLLYSRAAMVVFPTHGPGNTTVKLCVRRNGEYDLTSLQARTRTKVRRGLEKCRVRPVSWERMAKDGLAINEEALKRQQRRSRRLKSAAWWERQCRISAEFQDVSAWGVFVEERLTGYVHILLHDGVSFDGAEMRVANIAHFMTDSKYLKSYPNEALIYSVTKIMLEEYGASLVVLGNASNDRELLSWKRHMGYTEEDISTFIFVNPLLHLIKFFSPKLKHYLDRRRDQEPSALKSESSPAEKGPFPPVALGDGGVRIEAERFTSGGSVR
jgi:hypothetical protein